MRIRILAVGICVGLAASAFGEGKIFKFDMGPKDSPVWPGFIQVSRDSLYDKTRGYGWEKTGGIKDEARRPVLTNGGRVRPDDLCGDFVYEINSPFLLDAPDGEYKVYLILGDISIGNFYPSATQYIRVNGAEKYREEINADNFFTPKYYFRSMDKEWRKGDPDIWTKWIDPYFPPIVFTVKAVNGRLNFEFSPTCKLDCLVVYGTGESAAAEKEIAEITKQRQRSFEDKYYEESPFAGKGAISGAVSNEFTPTEEQKKKGYVIFRRNYVEPVYPASKPAQDEIGKELGMFAAQGAAEPAAFCVYALKDLKGVKIACADLVNDKGAKINRDQVRIAHVTYRETPYFMVNDRNSYQILPFLLKEKAAMDFESGVTRRIWITVNVPEESAAGIYQGKITFQPENAEPVEIALKVRVLPFKLDPMPEDASFGFYYYPPDWLKSYFRKEEKFREMVGKDLGLLKKNNLTSLLAGIQLPEMRVENEKLVVDFKDSVLDKFMGAYCGAGLKAPMGWYHYTDNAIGAARRMTGIPSPKSSYDLDDFSNSRFTEMVKNITGAMQAHGKEMRWPELLFYLQDEYGARDGQKAIAWAKKVVALYHELPGIKICGGVCNDFEMQMIADFDLPLLNPVVLTKDNVEVAIKKAKTMGFYNIGNHRINGFYFWKMNAKMHMQWVYSTGLVDPYNPFDSAYEGDLTIAFPSMAGPVPVVEMEIIREAFDDYRYCRTLDALIKKSLASDKAELKAQAERSRGVLDNILAQIRPDYMWYITEGSFPSVDVYDKLRWRIAQEIIKLNGLNKAK